MAAKFPEKRITYVGDKLDFRGMIVLRVLQLMHGVLVIDRISR